MPSPAISVKNMHVAGGVAVGSEVGAAEPVRNDDQGDERGDPCRHLRHEQPEDVPADHAHQAASADVGPHDRDMVQTPGSDEGSGGDGRSITSPTCVRGGDLLRRTDPGAVRATRSGSRRSAPTPGSTCEIIRELDRSRVDVHAACVDRAGWVGRPRPIERLREIPDVAIVKVNLGREIAGDSWSSKVLAVLSLMPGGRGACCGSPGTSAGTTST